MASLWEYANPVKFLALSQRILPACWILAGLCLGAGLIWGFFFTPDDFRQGSTVKIIYLHVPSALMAINAWLMMLVASLIWLIRRHHVSALAARAAAPVGAVMTVIALLTGAIWGQPMWGTWWEWDARITSELILLFLYLGYLALRNAIPDPRRADRASSLLVLVGVVNIPIIYFSVEWWNTLHQGSSIKLNAQTSMDETMLVTLLVMVLGFWAYSIAMALTRVQQIMLQRERATDWVRTTCGYL